MPEGHSAVWGEDEVAEAQCELSGGVGAVPFGKVGRAVAYDVDYIGEASAVERSFFAGRR